ncbi:MAG: Serine/threonine-protein kinase pkn1 [bacterium ADurb.Bin429]|nr:MAG: Serine/threonine-protein kinase pkn1 [bacterium ADurb.Bin429]
MLCDIIDAIFQSSRLGDLSEAEMKAIQKTQCEKLDTLYQMFQFLSDYALIGIDEYGDQGAAVIRIFRGIQPQTLEVTLADGTEQRPYEAGLYLLSLKDREQVLPLWPLCCRRPVTPNTLLGWRKREGEHLIYAPFIEGGTVKVSWEEIVRIPEAQSLALLSDESWRMLVKRLVPLDKREKDLVPGYELHGGPFYIGAVTDIYLAVAQTESRASQEGRSPDYAVHILRDLDDEILNEHIRRRFAELAENWLKLSHECILPIRTRNCAPQCEQPYLAVEYLGAHTSLQQIQQDRGVLPHKLIVEVMQRAAEVCREAHRNQLCILSLPLRHILLGRDDTLFFTGFDTLWREDTPLPAHDLLCQLCNNDRGQFAPELQNGEVAVEIPADIYALGILLRQLLAGQSKSPLHRSLHDLAWSGDPWDGILFHCLVHDPNMRFRSIDHFDEFFTQNCLQPHDPIPETVVLDNGLCISKYPVMNREYHFFCQQEKAGRCMPFGAHHKEQERFHGPFLPVVGVSLVDASDYCAWLSQKTGRRWRLPSEREWLTAAGGNNAISLEERYPWGSGTGQQYANYDYYYSGPTVVGSFSAGRVPAGCCDMGGNVWEWCIDRLPDTPRRMLKGGSYRSVAADLQLAARRGVVVAYRANDTGFRVVCE